MGYSDLGKDWQHSLVLATGSADGSIHVFDLSKGQVSAIPSTLTPFVLLELTGREKGRRALVDSILSRADCVYHCSFTQSCFSYRRASCTCRDIIRPSHDQQSLRPARLYRVPFLRCGCLFMLYGDWFYCPGVASDNQSVLRLNLAGRATKCRSCEDIETACTRPISTRRSRNWCPAAPTEWSEYGCRTASVTPENDLVCEGGGGKCLGSHRLVC